MQNRVLSPELEAKVAALPETPGVYIMKDSQGTVIYVGKAVVLKNRVRQYFGALEGKDRKVAAMVSNVAIFDYIITDSELEALILECNLIKQYQPKYNILLRDDKHYPYVRIDPAERYPRVTIVRSVTGDGAKYFGPYIAAHDVREALDAVHKLFPIRSCNRDLSIKPKKNARPCLNAQMGRCLAPCAGSVSEEEYGEMLRQISELLAGKGGRLAAQIEREMKKASDELDFERAAVLRDKLYAIRRISERQKADYSDLTDRDVLAAASEDDYAVVQAFFVRGGKLSHTRKIELKANGESEAELLSGFIKQYYAENPDIPRTIYTHVELPEEELLADWLRSVSGKKREIICPKRGSNKKLAELAAGNAQDAVKNKKENDRLKYERGEGARKRLAAALGIEREIHRMECYDISNTQGTDSVASMVVSIDGKPAHSEYRRFKIKTVEGANDFASMAEVLTRRLMRGFEAEDKERGFGAMPDLIVVDGGKGQLSSAYDVLLSLGVEDIPIAGIAKREEELFLPNRSDPVVLKRTSPELKLVTSLRDEAHRFAITFHRKRREGRNLTSELDGIEGVGPTRKKALFTAFPDVEAIKNADIDELVAVKGMNIRAARAVYAAFHPAPQP